MNATRPNPRIAAFSRRIQRTFRALLVVIFASLFILWVLKEADISNVKIVWGWNTKDSSGQAIPFDRLADYIVWGAWFLVSAFLLIAPIVYFDRLLSVFQHGRFFSVEATRMLQRIGLLLIAQVLAEEFLESLCFLILFLVNGFGTILLKFEFDARNLTVIGLSLLIIVLARLMEFASEAVEERELTI